MNQSLLNQIKIQVVVGKYNIVSCVSGVRQENCISLLWITCFHDLNIYTDKEVSNHRLTMHI